MFGRLFSLSILSKETATNSSVKVKTIHTARGFIYDRNLIQLVNNGKKHTICVKPTPTTINYFKENDKKIFEKLSKGYFVVETTESVPKIKSDDIKILPTYNRYDDSTAVHIIGYTDKSGNGICGIEKYYDDYLRESGGALSIAYSTDALNRLLLAEKIEIRDAGYYDKSGIILTIDKSIQKICEAALIKGRITKGAAIVLDINTSEILACCSMPVYDRINLSQYTKSKDSPFINRVFCAYPVGSVFKVITASSALENNISINDFCCTGSITKSGRNFRCNKLEGHQKINFNNALSLSCNPYFIELGTTLGREKLIETAEKFGLGKAFDLGNGFKTQSGVLPTIDDLNSDAAIGNLSFGQGKLTATPLQIATVFSTIANNGIYIEPKLIKGFSDSDGTQTINNENTSERVLKESTCKALKKALINTTIDGTGILAHSKLFDICAKTSTAQSGQFNESNKEIKYCWFAGFFPAEKPEYAICIMKEDGISGGGDCGPVFKEIAEKIESSR